MTRLQYCLRSERARESFHRCAMSQSLGMCAAGHCLPTPLSSVLYLKVGLSPCYKLMLFIEATRPLMPLPERAFSRTLSVGLLRTPDGRRASGTEWLRIDVQLGSPTA